jgi:zinc/manganese transport system permease protein
VHHLLTWIVEPGFLASAPDRTAAFIGGIVAVVSATAGVFTVMRGQSFAGHALGDVAAAGGSGALLIGLTPLTGFLGLGIIGAGVMDLIGVQRARGRDLATGIVLGAAIGLTALFLYLDTTASATTGATQQVLFGSIFTATSTTIPVITAFSLVATGIIAVIWRPLLLATVSPDIAAARGVPVRLVGVAYLVTLAIAVALSSLTTGAILSTALLIGPAATALRLTRRTGTALLAACLTGVAATWAGILLAYDSYYWGAARQGLPVSFFIVAVIFTAYLLAGLAGRRNAARPRDVAPADDAARDQAAA